MRSRFLTAVVALSAAGLGACGGPEDYELSSARGAAAGASADIIQACFLGSGDPSEAKLSAQVDVLLEAYDESGEDAEVEATMEEAAGDLRECGTDSLADRLNEKTDG